MEASALTTASHGGLLARRSPLLRLQSDEKLVALIREGHDRAFEVLFDRYQSRLLAFCRHLVGTLQDAEDVLQEVFVAAHAALLADERSIKARPWLYRIARNRCLNFLRRPVADGQESMDVHPYANGATTLEQVQRREELRAIVADVHELPETQRAALVLREIDDLSYTEIAQAMDTTLPAVKSLLVRARMSLAEASEARILTCDEVRLELAEAAEGLNKASGPARRHVRDCASCRRYRAQLRSSSKALAALSPIGLLALLRGLFGAKIGGGSAGGSAAGGSAGVAGGGAAGTAGGAAAAAGGTGLGGAVGFGGAATGIGGALGAKAAVGMATAALITASAVGVRNLNRTPTSDSSTAGSAALIAPSGTYHPTDRMTHHVAPSADGAATAAGGRAPASEPASPATAPAPPAAEPTAPPADPAPAAADAAPADESGGAIAPAGGGTGDPATATGDDAAVGGSSTEGDGGYVPDPPPPAPDPAPQPDPSSEPTPLPDSGSTGAPASDPASAPADSGA